MGSEKNKGIRIEKKSFLLSLAFMALIMIGAYLLTLVVPGGTYARVTDENGNQIIDLAAGFTPAQGGIPFWK